MTMRTKPQYLQNLFKDLITQNGLPLQLSGTPAFLQDESGNSIWSVSFVPFYEASITVYKQLFQRACAKSENITYRKVILADISIDSETWIQRVQLQCSISGVDPPSPAIQIIKPDFDISKGGVLSNAMSNMNVNSKSVTTKTSAATSFNTIANTSVPGVPLPIHGSDNPGIPTKTLGSMYYYSKNPTIFSHELQIVKKLEISSKTTRGTVLFNLSLLDLINQNMVSATKDCEFFHGSIIANVEMLANPVVAGAIMIGYGPPNLDPDHQFIEEELMGTECAIVSATDSQNFSFTLSPYQANPDNIKGMMKWLEFDSTKGIYSLPLSTTRCYPRLVCIARNKFSAVNSTVDNMTGLTISSMFAPDFYPISRMPQVTGTNLTDSAWVQTKPSQFTNRSTNLTEYGLGERAILCLDGRSFVNEKWTSYPVIEITECSIRNIVLEDSPKKPTSFDQVIHSGNISGSPPFSTFSSTTNPVKDNPIFRTEIENKDTSLVERYVTFHINTKNDDTPTFEIGDAGADYDQVIQNIGTPKIKIAGSFDIIFYDDLNNATDAKYRQFNFADVEVTNINQVATCTRHVKYVNGHAVNTYFSMDLKTDSMILPIQGNFAQLGTILGTVSITAEIDLSNTIETRNDTNKNITPLPGTGINVMVQDTGFSQQASNVPGVTTTGTSGPTLLTYRNLYEFLYPTFGKNLCAFDIAETVTGTTLGTFVYHPGIKNVFVQSTLVDQDPKSAYMTCRYAASQLGIKSVTLLEDNGSYPSQGDVNGFISRYVDIASLPQLMANMNVHGNAVAGAAMGAAGGVAGSLEKYFEQQAQQDWYWKVMQQQNLNDSSMLDKKLQNAKDIQDSINNTQLEQQRELLKYKMSMNPSNSIAGAINSSVPSSNSAKPSTQTTVQPISGYNYPISSSSLPDEPVSRKGVGLHNSTILVSQSATANRNSGEDVALDTKLDPSTGGRVIYPTKTRDLGDRILGTRAKVLGLNVDSDGNEILTGDLADRIATDQLRMPEFTKESYEKAKNDEINHNLIYDNADVPKIGIDPHQYQQRNPSPVTPEETIKPASDHLMQPEYPTPTIPVAPAAPPSWFAKRQQTLTNIGGATTTSTSV